MLKKKKNSDKRIIYISRTYLGSYFSAHIDILHPDPIYIKHQYQLLNIINQLNYKTLIKPHPRTLEDTKKFFCNLKFLKFCSNNIKFTIRNSDILIFDCIQTSLFYELIGTNLPIVYIDLNEHKIIEKPKLFIKQRCGYVPTRLDKENNIVFDIKKLSEQIKKSLFLTSNKELFKYIS